MREIRIPAFAKVNLRLDVLGKRADGYHELRTIFHTVTLHDTLRFRPRRGPGIELQIQGNPELSRRGRGEESGVSRGRRPAPRTEDPSWRRDSLAEEDSSRSRAWRRVERCRRRASRVSAIHAEEAACDSAPGDCRRAWADVPFFLLGGRALGIGKGDEIYPLPDIPKLDLLIVSPKRDPCADAGCLPLAACARNWLR